MRRFEFAQLEHSLQVTDLTLQELHDNAARLLRVIAPVQTRYKVVDKPDSRTIRYYVSQHLLPKPVSYDGGRANYSGHHLIRLLFIKKLQAQHFSLKQIKNLFSRMQSDGRPIELLMLAQLADGDSQESGEAADINTAKQFTQTRIAAQEMLSFPLVDGAKLMVNKNCMQDDSAKSRLIDSLFTMIHQLQNKNEE